MRKTIVRSTSIGKDRGPATTVYYSNSNIATMINRTNSAAIAVVCCCYSLSWIAHHPSAVSASVVPRNNQQHQQKTMDLPSQFQVSGGGNLIPDSVQRIPTPAERSSDSTANSRSLEEDEPWRKKNDWWKDPLSMFDENDEFVDPDVEAEKERKRQEEAEAARVAAEEKARQEQQESAESESSTISTPSSDSEDVQQESPHPSNSGSDNEEVPQEPPHHRTSSSDNEEEPPQQKAPTQPAQREVVKPKSDDVTEEQRQAAIQAEQETKMKLEQLQKQKEQEIIQKQREQEKLAEEKKKLEMEQLQKQREQENIQKQREQEKLRLQEEKEAQRKRQMEEEKETKQALVPVSAKSRSINGGTSLGGLVQVPNLQGLSSSLPTGISIASLTQLATHFPVMKVFATFTLGKMLMEKIIRSKKKDSAKLEENDDFEDELENLPFRQEPVHFSEPVQYTEEDLADDSEVESDVDRHGEMNAMQQQDQVPNGFQKQPMSHFQPQHHQQHHYDHSSQFPRTPQGPFSGLKAVLGGGSKVTFEELEHLRIETERAVAEKQAMEQEYEKTSFQLQEVQSEIAQLTSTTKYLKSQLRDYEEMMDRTIRNERKKAKVELRRMKELMESTREKDRAALRRQFTKELERMQAQYEQALEDKEGGDNSTRKAIQ